MELLLGFLEDAVAHDLWDALEVAGNQHHAISGLILEGNRLHPQVVKFSVRGSFGAIPGQPH